jgi:hypothetical protein
MELQQTIRFINFKDFQALGEFPRFPDNRELTRILGTFDRETSLIIFVSHCWLRGWSGAEGWDGRPHPDTATGDKYKLCVEGIRWIWAYLASEMKECYIWCDYGCIDQNKDQAGELNQLKEIVEVCDCIFTPIYDKDHSKWDLTPTFAGLFEDYKSSAWIAKERGYLNRGWCRVEMFYASNIPLVEDSEERKRRMKAGLLIARTEEKRRPHLLYGSKEKAEHRPPIILPPLRSFYFEIYNPGNGSLTKLTDRDKITRLVTDLRPYMKKAETLYEGEMKDGRSHGKGICVGTDGCVYTGMFEDGEFHGKGKIKFAGGSTYVGDWRVGRKHGYGKFEFDTGDIYEGAFVNDNRHGKGKFKNVCGDVFEGDYVNDKWHGIGIYRWVCGDVYNGKFKDGKKDGKGKLDYADGSAYEGYWKEDKKHGKGKFDYGNGNVYEGEWENDKEHGHGRFAYADGNLYEGGWVDGKSRGKGKIVFADRSTYEGEFNDDYMHGNGRFSSADGTIYEGQWEKDMKHGEGKIIFASGAVLEGMFKDGAYVRPY